MSGGHFDYQQNRIQNILEEIEALIDKGGYSKETLKEFANAKKLLEKAFVYIQRIDWLVSGDDGEETFHERLSEALRELNKQTGA